MYLFLIIALPCYILIYCISNRKFNFKSYIPLLSIGFLSAAIACTVRGLFIYTSHLWKDSFLDSFIHIYLIEEFIPALIIYVFFLLFSKDSKEYKSSSVIPLLGSFYAVSIPFYVISEKDYNSFYMIFAKPAVFIFMLTITDITVKSAFSTKKTKFNPILMLTLLNTFIPSIIESQWRMLSSKSTITIEIVIYAVITIMVILTSKFSKVKANQV